MSYTRNFGTLGIAALLTLSIQGNARADDNGGNDNGKLPVTYDDFEAYGVHRHSIAPGIREAEALGFIEITERGQAGNAEFRRPTLFRITFRNTGRADPTDEWRQIKTEEEAKAIARQARKNRNPVSVFAKSRCRNRHRKPQIHSAETTTTCVSAESTTTLDISGGIRTQ